MSATGELAAQFAADSPATFWSSLEERARTPAFRTALAREFPDIATRFGAATDRRTALKLLGASLLMAGLAGCKVPEGIAPYVIAPEQLVPGRPRYYATTLPLDGYGVGVLAESHEGRPTKIEGNPRHPASLGGTDPRLQASVWSLYDPTRSRVGRRGTEPAAWTEFAAAIADLRAAMAKTGGQGVALAIGAETSPTLARQLAALRQEFPALRLFRHAPTAPAAGSSRPLNHLDAADVILSLGADFLGEGPARLADARAFADGRRVRRDRRRMSRLYTLEVIPTLTGAAADWSRHLTPPGLAEAARSIADAMNGAEPDPQYADIVRDLRAAGPKALVIGNSRWATDGVAAAINQHLGVPVTYIADQQIGGDGDVYDLAAAIDGGTVGTLVTLGVDLIHSAPGDLDLTAALRRLKLHIHLGRHMDATAQLAHWHVPQSHPLESWSDLRAYDGTASIVQPLIAPLYDSHTAHELLALLSGDFSPDVHSIVRATWASLGDTAWVEALRSGLIGDATPAPATPPPSSRAVPATAAPYLVLKPDPYLGDGDEAANLVLQELPRPLTKQVWGNAAEIGPAMAARLGVSSGDELSISRGGKSLILPAFVLPGMPDDTVAISLGHGRLTADPADVTGANAFALMSRSDAPATITATGRHAGIVTTQEHHAMEGRDLVRELPLAAYPPAYDDAPAPSLFPPVDNPDEAWGMSIDLTACIGCMACVAACQVENNSPVVGAAEMARGHDMHWLRVDRYFGGEPNEPKTLFQPVPCMHCEEAPCEVVCPVNATVHTHDGLNAQVYNRCVGTRYCSQNCPYKVRRFNFSDYQAAVTDDSPLSLLMNPDVTVRERGVMEKCTYCVQRIAKTRIDADVAGGPMGEVLTACQQACPTRAITFGNLKDRASAVARDKVEPQAYALLAELGTRPRTTYLARLRNDPDHG
jgi:molybdopterin-containing oxidoreductase family iron-sulfur binding subunit